MAQIPLPLGIGKVLVEIAEGLGAAAQALPTSSRSFVGAVAMRTARMRIDFELANATSERDSGLGIRTNQIVGIGAVENATITRGASKGFVEFEIVAIADAVEAEREAPRDRRVGRTRTKSAQPDPGTAATPAAREADASTEAVPPAAHLAQVMTSLTGPPAILSGMQLGTSKAPVPEEAGDPPGVGSKLKTLAERRKAAAEAKVKAKGRRTAATKTNRGKGG